MDANAALSQLSYEPKLILQRQMILYHNFLHCKDCFFQKDAQMSIGKRNKK